VTRIVLLAAGALAAFAVLRRRRAARPRVHVAWRDGAELDLSSASSAHGGLVLLTERVLA
jgi:hypothetical protein